MIEYEQSLFPLRDSRACNLPALAAHHARVIFALARVFFFSLDYPRVERPHVDYRDGDKDTTFPLACFIWDSVFYCVNFRCYSKVRPLRKRPRQPCANDLVKGATARHVEKLRIGAESLVLSRPRSHNRGRRP